MDLPPDKARLLKNYDFEKKWDIICDQEMVHAKDPPSYYLNKLRTYLDPKASRSHRKRKMVGDSTSTQVLRDLEISLRTNHIEWVREFLSEENNGLDVLIDYLSFRLGMMRHEQRITESQTTSQERLNSGGTFQQHNTSGGGSSTGVGVGDSGGTNSRQNGYARPALDVSDSPSIKRRSKHVAKLNMGEAKDDIHVCIMCMRAIMNNKYGFNMVIQHREAINCISLSLIHKSLRTKALVLELLAAICLVKGGHEIILSAFDNFKEICQEARRFQTLMDFFMNFDMFHIEFMVACMQFINIVVHSVEHMNFRVHLQYEFTALGLDKYLERLRFTESEELQIQISAYLDNVFDVATLLEDSETKTAALEKMAEMEYELIRVQDTARNENFEYAQKCLEMETKVAKLEQENEDLRENMKIWREKSERIDSKLIEFEKITNNVSKDIIISEQGQNQPTITLLSSSSADSSSVDNSLQTCNNKFPSVSELTSAPIPPPPPCPPPAPVKLLSAPLPPPLAGLMQAPDGAMTIKRKVQTKYKLPTVNWIALKPNQVRGTIFNELDDDRLFNYIDFDDFEEKFKIGQSTAMEVNCNEIDGLTTYPSKRFKKPEKESLLEHTRLRNIAISRRKLNMPIDKVINSISTLDLKQLSLDNVELLQKMIPSEQECKAYRDYVMEGKSINNLSEEDKFLMQLTKVERISIKLSIMNYIGNFYDNLHLIMPQVSAVISACNSVKNSRKLKGVLEVVLAFGNYLNSSKRGPTYGFKLQSLDTLQDTKSSDKRMSLLHYIVAAIRDKFPELLNFDSELLCIEKAATVSLENITTDVQELEKGMDMVRKEADGRGRTTQNLVIRDFLSNSEEKLRKLKNDAKTANDIFKEMAEYFAESPRATDANTFFSLLVRFTKAFKNADFDNENRRRLEQTTNNSESVQKLNKYNEKKQHEAVINELKHRTKMVHEKKLLQQDEVYNGALEDILLGLKSEPYRRADAVRRSQRRRIDNNRLSKTMEEMEF
ncbi:formin-like protein CG32138 [Agrilus planipennis]|uniref:Formin-like protein CG32138 n=1 Tax=Agrilus planipennis TaxID=224129 RepID=A0A1W4XP08_AGRPL|nr:formin-like protein CG32138 [Agrilus planipennis]